MRFTEVEDELMLANRIHLFEVLYSRSEIITKNTQSQVTTDGVEPPQL